MRLARAGLLTPGILLATAAVAQAAYAPRLDVKVDPATPDSPIALTSTITQAGGETANRSARITFPPGFAPTLGSKVVPCKQEQVEAGCPPESQVGTGHAETEFARLDGPVHLVSGASGLRLHAALRGLGGLLDVPVTGDIAVAGGRAGVTLEMPDTAMTVLELALEGGEKALWTSPKTCGPGVFEAEFTSHQDEKAADTAAIETSGCATTPVVSAVTVSPRAFRAQRTFSDSQRRGFSTTLRYTLSEATNGARVKIYKRAGRRWRYVASFVAPGDAGANSVSFDGRVRNRRLSPGRYRFTVRTVGRSGRASNTGAATFAVRR